MGEIVMIPFRRILFPIDFSEAALAMVPYVHEMAQRFHSTVTVLNVFDLVHDYRVASCSDYEYADIPYTATMQKLRDQRYQRLEEFSRSYFSDVGHSARMEDGDPAMVIEGVAQREGTDLIVMPTKGLGRFRRLLLGSITAKVLHDVTYPVLTGAHVTESGFVSPGGYRSILCGVELNAEAGVILKAAGDLAQAYSARLFLLHIEPSHEHREPASPESIDQAFREASGSEITVDVTARVLAGGIAEGIRRTALEESADLVVVGRGHQTGISRMWSHLYKIVSESPCPVLSV